MSFIKFLTSGNPQMQNMIAPAVEKLKKRTPEDICTLSGAEYRKDEDFPVSGKVLTDAGAVHYLSMEGCGTACILTLRTVAEQLNK